MVWYYGLDEICPWASPDSGGGTACAIIPNLDDDIVRVEVRDIDGAGASNAVVLSVFETNAPTAEILEPLTSGVYYSDQKVTFLGQIGDAEDTVEMLNVEWISDIDGTLNANIEVSSGGEISSASYLNEGEHLITLAVTDSTDKREIDTTTITVGPPNSAPSCQITAPESGSTVVNGDLIVFEATVADADVSVDRLSIEWTSDKDGNLGTSTANTDGTVSFSVAALSVDNHNITLRVEDELEATCVDSIFVQVGTPPTVTIQSPIAGSTINETDPVVFTILVEDEQSQPNDVGLVWTLDGLPYTTIGATSTGIAEFTEQGLSIGNHTLSILGTDPDGLTDSDQVSFTINGAPSAPVVEIVPTTAFTTDDLSVNIMTPAVDPEGQNVTNTIQWYRNGVLEVGTTNTTVSASNTSKSETWSVEVTPSDGLMNGPAGTASITISNAAPTISSVTITPSIGVTSNDVLTCSASVQDADDPVTPSYSWNINGQSASGSSVNLTNYAISGGDTVTCIVEADDGYAAPVTQSTSVTVDNQAPVVSSISLTQHCCTRTVQLLVQCKVKIQMATPLTETLTWLSNGQSIGGGSSITLTGLASSGDAIICEVIVDDGSTFTMNTSSPVVILNTLPTAPSITMSSGNANGAPAAEQHDLYCTITASSTDIDGDSHLLQFCMVWSEWTDNQPSKSIRSC